MGCNDSLFVMIQAPKLMKIRQPILIEIDIEYRKYQSKFDDINSDRSKSNKVWPSSICDSIGSKLLHALSIMGKIQISTPAEQALNEMVNQWFEPATSVAHATYLE